MKFYRYISASLVVFCAANILYANGRYESSLSVSTPHVKWGKNWSAGKVRVLALIAGRKVSISGKGGYVQPGMKQRDAVELVQRFDFSMDTVIMAGSYTGYPVKDRSGKEPLTALLKKGDYDVLLLGNVSLYSLTPEQRYIVLDKIKNGAGLVDVQQGAAHVFLKKNKLELPASIFSAAGVWKSELFKSPENEKAAIDSICSVYKIGKGRGVSIKYPIKPLSITPDIPYSIENATLYEYWSALVGRSILWAADKTPEVVISQFENSKDFFTVKNLSKDKIDFSLNITMKDIRGENTIKSKQLISLKGDESKKIKLNLSNLPNGRYYVDIVAQKGKQNIGFGTLVIDIDSNPSIKSVELDSDFTELGGSINLNVKSPALSDAIIRSELVTADRRTVWREEKSSGNVSFELNLSKALMPSISMRTRVSLIKDGKVLDVRELPLTVTQRNRNGFKFVVYERDMDVLSYYAFRKLKHEGGVNASVCWGDPGEVLAANNISQLLYLCKVDTRRDSKGNPKYYSWNDDNAIDAFMKKVIGLRTASRKHGVLGYSLGDEPPTQGVDKSLACKNAYRKFLKQRYGNIDKLNKIWKSDYKSFEQVDVLDPNDLEENGAKKKGLYARWFDRQTFMRKSFTNVFSRFKPIAEKHDPKAIIGFEGAGSLQKFPDFEGLLALNGFWATYNDPSWDIIRSMTDKDFVTSKWMGYTYNPEAMVNYSWQTVAKGADSLWYWRWCGIGKFHGLMNPDMEIWKPAKAMFENIRILREGFGDLWVAAEKEYDGVAVLLSNASHSASFCPENDKFGFAGAHNAIMAMFRSFGIGYRYVTPSQIKKGWLEKSGTKILFLMSAYAISDKEAAEIKDFVKKGGTVVADVRPGVFDKYCRPRDTGILDDLFGVKHNIRSYPQNRKLSVNFGGGQLNLSSSVQDYSLKSKSGDDNVPLMKRKSYGRGSAILFNFTIDSLPRVKGKNKYAKARKFFEAIFKTAHLKLPVQISSSEKKFDDLQVLVKKYGKARIISLYSCVWQNVKLSFGKNEYVYGINVNVKEASRDSVRFFIPARRAVFLIVTEKPIDLPYKIKADKIAHPGKPAKVTIGNKDSLDPAAFYVYLERPDGTIADWSKKSLINKTGQVTYTWTPAWEDQCGEWIIHIIPVITGESIQKKIHLSKDAGK